MGCSDKEYNNRQLQRIKIGHFRVSPAPLYQNEVKCFAFDMDIIFHSQERLCTWPHFESEGSWNSEVAYRWFSRYVIAAMLVDGKQKIAH